ncbi:hypothetical protein B0H14DRAFT_2602060 [Mycena olivaceomarginata]|nr:hypothetical protein B0H14DRAFT_2602060 [Mycena olivaceomarginata]
MPPAVPAQFPDNQQLLTSSMRCSTLLRILTLLSMLLWYSQCGARWAWAENDVQVGDSTASHPTPDFTVSGTPAHLKFTGFFTGFFESQGTDMKSGEPSSKKRKTADDRAAEEGQR